MGKTLHLFMLLALFFLTGGGISANAQTTVTFTAGTDKGTSTSQTADKVTKDGITISSTSAALATTQYRFYANSTTTISSTVGNITKVVFTCTPDKKNKYASSYFSVPKTNGVGTYTASSDGKTGTWTGDASSFTLSASAQVRATTIEVTYTPSSTGKTETTLVFADPADKTFALNATEGTNFTNAATLTPAVEGAKITYSSDKESIATVDENGGVIVKTDKEGTATITATYDGNDEYAGSTTSYKITVADPNKASWSYTFKKDDLKDGSTSYSFNNVAWTFTPTWESTTHFFGYDSNGRGLQIGKKGYPATSIVFSSTGFPGVIKEVKVNAATASGATATIAVTVGGVSYGEAKSLTTSSADYTFTGSASGEVVITLSQPSTTAALYIKSIDIEYNPSAATTLTLDENATKATITADKNVNVTLKRTFNDNAWNTLVLPFDLTAEQIAAAFGADAKVAAYTGATAGADGTYTLNFKEATTITANTPVFIHSAQNQANGYTFTGVEVKDATPTQTAEGFNFVGTYTATTVPVGNYFINSSNKFYKAGDDKTNIKGTRATFEPVGAAATAKGLGFNVTEDGTTTAINSITMQEELNVNAPMYNLAGQQVTKAYKGVILQNGKKFINK